MVLALDPGTNVGRLSLSVAVFSFGVTDDHLLRQMQPSHRILQNLQGTSDIR